MKATAVILFLWCVCSSLCFSQESDRMTFKSFATAKGKALFIDIEAKEVLWRFESEIEMRFPFKDINFILFGVDRRARVVTGSDSTMQEGIISEFSPARGLKLRPGNRKTFSLIMTDIKRISLEEMRDTLTR